MTIGHTPKPWKSDDHAQIWSDDGRLIARVLTDYIPRAVADIQLIVAAPELLALGNPILLQYKNLRAACGLTNDMTDIREFEDAFARARGEGK